MKRILILLSLLVYGLTAQAQVSVAPSPVAKQQFFGVNGAPLASGCIFTYISTTSTPQATYQDYTGTAVNTNPIILDSGGFANIWLTNNTYRFVLVSAGGVNCASGVTQYTIDGISAYTIINSPQNLFLLGATSDPSGTAGELAYRSDIPCFRGFTTFWDCFVRLTDPQTLTNKTLSSPVFTGAATGLTATAPTLNSPTIAGLTLGGVNVATGNPTNFANFTNGAAGTGLNLLAKLVPLGSGTVAVSPLTSDVGGVVGVVIAGNGVSGINLVQRTGQVLCVFDGATTVDDYVQISPTTSGDCHDTGQSTYPTTGGQIIGRVLTTNVGAGTYLIDLFPPEIRAGGSASIACTNFTPVTVTNNNTNQNLQSCTVAANALAQGNLLSIDVQGIESNASAGNTVYAIGVGGGTVCQTQPTQGVANNQPWNIIVKFSVLTSGAGGTANMSCEYFSSASGGGVLGPQGVVGSPTISINTTISNLIQITEQMSVANAGNSVTSQLLKAVIF